MNDMSKPVFPFKAGDVVECVIESTGTSLTSEGRTYRVHGTYRNEFEHGDFIIAEDYVLIDTDAGCRTLAAAASFCAPGESRGALRRRIAELEAEAGRREARLLGVTTERDQFRGSIRALAAEKNRLETRFEELENMLKDTRINTVASGLRDEIDRQIVMREETERALVKARAEYKDMVAQRDLWIKKFHQLRETFRALAKACE